METFILQLFGTTDLPTYLAWFVLAFIGALILAIVAVLSLLYKINEHFLVSIPGNGGTLSEGVVCTPRFVNPLLATTDADRDLTDAEHRCQECLER